MNLSDRLLVLVFSPLASLPQGEQRQICATLEQVANMMGGSSIEAAPVLTTSPAALSAEEITETVDGAPADVSPLGPVEADTQAIDEPEG